MHPLFKSPVPLMLAVALALGGCAASTQPVAYSGLASASQLRPNGGHDSGRMPYSYATAVTLRDYDAVIVDPVVIYGGMDAQFEDVTDAEKAALARYMEEQFKTALAHRYRMALQPDRHTLRLKLTLTGARSSTRFLSTASRFDLAGGPYNLVQGARGKEGAFTGSVSYAVELYDASTNLLVHAFVTKQYPSPMNISASLGRMDASQAGVRIGAEDLLARLR